MRTRELSKDLHSRIAPFVQGLEYDERFMKFLQMQVTSAEETCKDLRHRLEKIKGQRNVAKIHYCSVLSSLQLLYAQSGELVDPDE